MAQFPMYRAGVLPVVGCPFGETPTGGKRGWSFAEKKFGSQTVARWWRRECIVSVCRHVDVHPRLAHGRRLFGTSEILFIAREHNGGVSRLGWQAPFALARVDLFPPRAWSTNASECRPQGAQNRHVLFSKILELEFCWALLQAVCMAACLADRSCLAPWQEGERESVPIATVWPNGWLFGWRHHCYGGAVWK